MSDIIEKLKQIQGLISECISSQGEEESPEEDAGEEEDTETYSDSGDEAGDKIKMAASLLKKRMG